MKERTKVILKAAAMIARGEEEFTCCAIDRVVGPVVPARPLPRTPERCWYELWFKPVRTSQHAWLNLHDDFSMTYEDIECDNRARRLTFLAMAAAVSETEE